MNQNDFIIKDGNFIGEFENLYKNFDDPWTQSLLETYALEKTIGIELLKKNKHTNPMELGCGHGYYTNRVKESIGNCVGVDISKTAIEKAINIHPECEFIVSDIDNEDLFSEKIDCVMMVEITWYVLPKLKEFKEMLSQKYGGKGVGFFHSLNIYPEGVQKYGLEYFSNNKEIMEYFKDVIEIESFGEFSSKEFNECSRTFFYGKIK